MAPWLELPFHIEKVTPEEEKLVRKCLIGYSRPFVRCGKHGYLMPGAFEKHAEHIYNLQVRPDDVWVITFPRSGTTWTQELVWLVENNLDFETARSKPLYERFPMVEITSKIPDLAFELIKMNFLNLRSFQGLNEAVRVPSWKSVDNAPSPRFIKTHLPLSLLPPKLLDTAKVIYVARDPRDVAVSYYYFYKMVAKGLFRTSLKTFWDAFRKDLLPWTPVVAHTIEAWQQRNHPNLHFLFYEDLIQDLPKEILRMCKFMNREYSEEQMKQLADYLSFESLRKNKNVNNSTDKTVQFIRNGKIGSWKTHFDQKMLIQAEEYLISRLQGSDLAYPTFSTEDECSRL
ncbi:estrogen sulfotransferase-like [Hyposmocoma kahamanoa]|uniref:estrogen sulfotransferase-like n=1 Tax=Hyposmocoma kahamanoa TaxID=1477025 RepID=UPI000E6D792F|nr:estrogen sulfotransferase-like [Hyposmocoma kahamanoa]